MLFLHLYWAQPRDARAVENPRKLMPPPAPCLNDTPATLHVSAAALDHAVFTLMAILDVAHLCDLDDSGVPRDTFTTFGVLVEATVGPAPSSSTPLVL